MAKKNSTTSTTTVRRAVILAAGRGSRLGILTTDRPKPMVLVAGKPVLEHILVGLQRAGLDEFLLVVGYHAESIRGYFGDGARFGVKITYAEQPHLNGTGAALACAHDFAEGDTIVASFGDILTDDSHYRLLLHEYLRKPCAAVVGINPVEDPSAGSAVYRMGNRITGVVEKPLPGTAQSRWNLAGIGVYSPAIWSVLADLKPSPRGEYELTDAIVALIASEEEVLACELWGFWSDIGTPEALAAAEAKLQSD